jgi:hypothetical protein
MRHNILLEPVPRTWSPEAAKRLFLRQLDLSPATPNDILSARNLAARLISPDVASAATLQAVHRHAGDGAVFVFREPEGLTGVVGFAPLTPAGLEALLAERFDATAPDLAHVAAPGEQTAAGYGWGMAGSTPAARKAVVGAAIALYEQILPDLPWFTRAATPDGRRVVLGKFGYEPLLSSGSGLLARWPRLEERAA